MPKRRKQKKPRKLITMNMILSRKGGPMRDRRDLIGKKFPTLDEIEDLDQKGSNEKMTNKNKTDRPNVSDADVHVQSEREGRHPKNKKSEPDGTYDGCGGGYGASSGYGYEVGDGHGDGACNED